VARLTSPEPGVYKRSRVGELLRCAVARLGIRHAQRPVLFRSGAGQDPFYPVAVESGEELQKGPYVAETFPVHVEDSYVIIENVRHVAPGFRLQPPSIIISSQEPSHDACHSLSQDRRSEVLVWEEVQVGKPGPGEARIRIRPWA